MWKKTRPLRVDIASSLDTYNPLGPAPRAEIKFEVGKWTRTDESLKQFADYCAKNKIKSRGRVKVVTTDNHARTLRSTAERQPGDALITMPGNKGFNFLSVARRMMDEPHRFNQEITWKNWNLKPTFLAQESNISTSDAVTAAWMVRAMNTACPEHGVYMEWLLADDSGGAGVKEGFNQMIQMGSAAMGGGGGGSATGGSLTADQQRLQEELGFFMSSCAYDSCEEVEEFQASFNVALAAYLKRSVLMDNLDQISSYSRGSEFTRMPPVPVREKKRDGEASFSSRTTVPGISTLFLPTLYPLIDCCVQIDFGAAGSHNCLVDYIPPEQLIESNSELFYNLDIKPEDVLGDSEYRRHGLVALRALCQIPAGDYLSLRAFPKTANMKAEANEFRQVRAAVDYKNSGKDPNHSIQNLSKFGNHTGW